MCPDLPIPVTTTRPRHSNNVRAAARNGAPSRAESAVMALASVASTSRPRASARFASTPSAAVAAAAMVADIRESIPERPCGGLQALCYIGLMSHTLQLILLLLAAAVVALIFCRLVRLPPILGYLGVGIAVGPHALGWVPDNANVRGLAEFGIVFLMFSIGL